MSYASLTQRSMPSFDVPAWRPALEAVASAAGAFIGCAAVAAVLWVIVAAPGLLG